MSRLEEVTVGCQVNGVVAREPVTVVAVQWYGNAVIEVTFKNGKGSWRISCYIEMMKAVLKS